MKLRLLNDSIRLRLSRSDVAAADAQGAVEARTQFPDGRAFTYVLEASPECAAADVAYTGDRMVVRLPRSNITAWANDDTAVSLRSQVKLPSGEPLKLLIEKDFQCLSHRHDEDQSDLFQNPEVAAC